MRKGFISYSHADRAICDALMKHLGDLHRTRLRIWRDPDLKPGEKWNELIGWHIQRTHVGIVLVSSDAMKPGGFVPDIEIPLLQRGQTRGVTIIVPAIARPYDRSAAEAISEREAIPEKGRPLGADATPGEIDDWCAQVAAELRALVEGLPELAEHTPDVRRRRDDAQGALEALEACDAFFELHHGLVNDCQKLVSGLEAALRAPRADIWAAIDGLAARWAAFRSDRLAKDPLNPEAEALEARLDDLLAAIEADGYDWPPDLERARARRSVSRQANREHVERIDRSLERVEDEARILGQPGEAHLRDMERDAGDQAAIGRALLVGREADIAGARHAAGNAYRAARIIEHEIEALCDDTGHNRDRPNAQLLREAAEFSARPDIPVPEMVAIPPGRFVMGAPESEDGSAPDERPQHEVAIAYPFALGRYAVTFAEYDAYCADTGTERPNDEGWGRDRRPVIHVSWKDAQAYLAWLNDRLGLSGRPDAYRLPSEAEWEYACRAGTVTPFSFGETITPDQANYNGNISYAGGPKGRYHRKTMPVGSYPANGFGLNDMHGNVWEWCADPWYEDYEGAPKDGSVWYGGDTSRRVLRGGSWFYDPIRLRSAIRIKNRPFIMSDDIGFRVARSLADQTTIR